MIKRPENYVVIGTYFDDDGTEIIACSTWQIENRDEALAIANRDHDGSDGHTYIYQLEKEPCVVLSKPNDRAEDLYPKSKEIE